MTGYYPAIVARLNAEIASYLRQPETQKRFADEGAEIDIRTPDEIRRMVNADIAKWAKVAKAAKMHVE